MYIKVEHGDKIFVRVGGGFMNIEEFLHKYTKEESEKTKRKDTSNRLHNKLSV